MGNISNVIPAEAGNSYTYDYVGNRLTMMVTDGSGTRTHVYSHDNIYQITEVNYPDSLGYLATDTEFNYDAAGNRSSVIDGSGTCTYTTNNLNQYTAAGPTNFSYDTSGNMTHDANYAYYYDPENRLIQVTKSGGPTDLAAALDSFLTYTTGGAANWSPVGGAYAQSGYINHNQESWMQAQVEGPGTLTFQWKVSSEAGCDQLQFYLDDELQDAIDGEQDWDEISYQVTGSGTHTFRWRYQKDYSVSEGEDAGYVDQVQWTGPLPEDPPTDRWHHLTYVYDAAGRRIEKQYDYDTVLKYVYDGDHCIAEYDAGGNLRRKYIYGPAVDEPICMVESTGTYAGTYYYHFDALGSVVALTDGDANTVDAYEYDVYGRVGATDANHPNRFLFTGREYDKETGLYYYRARYYNPQIGRFLQTDPVGYGAGMNLYAYCANRPTYAVDPTGLKWKDPCDVKILFFNGNDDDIASIDQSYWDVVIDISGNGVESANFNSSDAYILSVINNLKQDAESQGYSWDQVHIGGVWFDDHGGSFNNGTVVGADVGTIEVWSDNRNRTTDAFFADLGAALDENHGEGAMIHLRQCNAGDANPDGQRPLLRRAALSSGHSVTGPQGYIDYYDEHIDGLPDYYSEGGYYMATPNATKTGVEYSRWNMDWDPF